MKTFEEVMRLTDTISNHHLLQPEECRAMYDVCVQLLPYSDVVEIGCDLGRSSSLIAQVALERRFQTIHVDPWKDEPRKARQWMEVMCELVVYRKFVVLRMTTEAAEESLKALTPFGIEMAYIDGCHDEPVVVRDLEIVAARVKRNGWLLIHDYPSAGVSEAVDRFIALGGWTKENQAGGLGIWRRR